MSPPPAEGLQWGRDLSVAEGAGSRQPKAAGNRASMGPRPFGRGRLLPAPTLPERLAASMGPRPFGRGRPVRRRPGARAPRRFNGAATFQSRKDDPCPPGMHPGGASMGPRPCGRGRLVKLFCRRERLSLLQWGRDLSVAEGGARDRTGRGPASFNGAATFRSRKVGRYHDIDPALVRFNGAATFRSRKAFRTGAIDRRQAGFNGAATFRSRKVARSPEAILHPIMLQWGRDLSVAEGGDGTYCWVVGRGASMGPRPFGRGRIPAAPPSGTGCGGFNGAATFRSRKALPAAYSPHTAQRLQWGRDLSVAEGLG